MAEAYGAVTSDGTGVAGCGWQQFQPFHSIPGDVNYS